MEDKSELIVNGYYFKTMEDAELARQEMKKIEYLERHMDYEKPGNMLLVYKKAVKDYIFKTPIGWEYLKKLQEKLYESEEFGTEIPPIGLFTVFAYRTVGETKATTSQIDVREKKQQKKKLTISVWLNSVLIVAIIAMFVITLTSDQPNILNYEKVLVNKYAAWEQNISERESVVRDKEREPRIEE